MTQLQSGHHLGHIKSKPDSRDVKLGDFLPGLKSAGLLPPLPEGFGHGNSFENWLMLGNGPSEGPSDVPEADTAAINGAGNCEVAAAMHEEMSDAKNTSKPIPKYNGKFALEIYRMLGSLQQGGEGYNLVTGANDNGLETRGVLQYRQDVGLPDLSGVHTKIGSYLFLDAKNPEELFYAMWLIERACIAIEFPETADTQFSEGKIWTPVKGAQIVGGHEIFGTGRSNPAEAAFITWGKRTAMDIPFYETYNDETATYITPGQFSTVTGKDYEGHDVAELERFLHETATQKALIFR